MTLQQAVSSMDNPVFDRLIPIIPNDMLGKCAEQFTSEMFSSLRKGIEQYVRGTAYTARIDVAREINAFFDSFFHNDFPKACRLERIFDNTEMDILLLRELQGGSDASRYSYSQESRADRFGMSTNAMQARIHSLERGKEILGHYVKIDIDGRGRTAYDNTIHPVFLAMNLKEAFFLTVELRKAFEGTRFEQLASDISSDVYGQLSEYARATLRTQIEDAGLKFEQPASDRLIDLRKESQDVIFFLKSGVPCTLRLRNGKTVTGRIQSGTSGLEIISRDGERLALPEDPDEYALMPADLPVS